MLQEDHKDGTRAGPRWCIWMNGSMDKVIKWTILEKRSARDRIKLLTLEGGHLVTKSMEMGQQGIGIIALGRGEAQGARRHTGGFFDHLVRCDRTAPTPVSEASTSTTRGRGQGGQGQW